jgi:hypothetical protein
MAKNLLELGFDAASIIWQHVSLRVYMNWWNGSSVAEATLLTDNGSHWDVMLLKSHFDLPKNSSCHTLHRMWNWMDRGQKAPNCQNRYEAVASQDPWWHCSPLYLTSRFIAKFGLFGFLRVTRITKYSVIWVTRITEFGNLDEFGWVQMIQIWRASKPNLASGI